MENQKLRLPDKMDKEKINSFLSWAFIVAILSISIISLLSIPKIPKVLENNEEFRYGWQCTLWKFESTDDADKGKNCLLEQCIITKQEPLAQQCICVLNNLSVNRICTNELYAREFPYPTYNPTQIIKINQSQYNDIVSGDKNLSDVI